MKHPYNSGLPKCKNYNCGKRIKIIEKCIKRISKDIQQPSEKFPDIKSVKSLRGKFAYSKTSSTVQK